MNDRQLLLWTTASRLPALAAAGRPIALLGGPDLAPRAHTDHHAEAMPDLAMALRAAAGADVLLAARPPAETLDWLDSRGVLADLKKRDNRLVALDPLPSSAMSPALRDAADHAALPSLAPSLRQAPLAASLRDALESFGHVQTALVASRDRGAFGGLGARLLDALDLLGELMGEPESIDAAIASPRALSGVRAAPADDLTLLRGSLTAHLRFESEASAVLSLSDQAGRWFRGITLAGESGLIRFDDRGFEWIGPDGAVVERTDAHEGDTESRLAESVVSGAFESDPQPAGARLRALVAAGAAVLSARTGQPEAPATVRRMANLHA